MPGRERVPIACTLDLQSMGRRLAKIQQLTREHLRSRRVDGRALRLTYGPEAAPEVAHIVELERVCCAFLDFAIKASADAVELSITAPERNDDNAQWLFAQFLPATPPAVAPATSGDECACCRS